MQGALADVVDHLTLSQPLESENVHLAWVLVGDELHPVSDFQGLVPRQRPIAYCPLCREPVTLKLGSIRAHHAAYQPDSVCRATQPETALHQNVKFYLAQQLRGTVRLEIEEPCSGLSLDHSACTSRRTIDFAAHWDDVQVEYTLDPLRPDIVLLAAGRPLAAIEIWVSHRVEEPKAEVLKQMGVPWIEVQGAEALYAGEDPWTSVQPLAVARHSAVWRCAGCQSHLARIEKAQAYEAQRQAQQAALAEQRRQRKPTHFRVVDIYYRSGKSHRAIFRLINQVDATGRVLARYLEEDGEVLLEIKPPFDEPAVSQQIQNRFIDRLLWYRQHDGTICDFAAPGWFDLAVTQPPTRNDPLWPHRYWRGAHGWFMPGHLREVKWFGDNEQSVRVAQLQKIRDAEIEWQKVKATHEHQAALPPDLKPVVVMMQEAQACVNRGDQDTARALYSRARECIVQLLKTLSLPGEAGRLAALDLLRECNDHL